MDDTGERHEHNNYQLNAQASFERLSSSSPPPPSLLIPGENADVFVTIFPNIGLTNMIDLTDLINYKDVSSFPFQTLQGLIITFTENKQERSLGDHVFPAFGICRLNKKVGVFT